LFILPASAVLLAFSEPIMRNWLGTTATTDQVRHAFQVLLVAHAVGALAVPAAMIGRACRWPLPEAVATTVAFGAALLGAWWAPTFVAAVAVLWGAPAVGGFVAWVWLKQAKSVAFVPVRDLIVAAAVAVAAYLVARGLATHTAGWNDLLIRLAVAGSCVGLAACAAELTNAASRHAVARLLSRSEA
jgi:hypothetical protein